jgi:hypothetical protein
MASIRKMLVPRYENMDDELVFGIFKKHLSDFDLFIFEELKKGSRGFNQMAPSTGSYGGLHERSNIQDPGGKDSPVPLAERGGIRR